MKVGNSASVTRRYHADDLAEFADLAGIDAVDVASVPEPLVAALFSFLLGVRLPGAGTNYLKQDLTFLAAVPLDEEVTATVSITRLRPDKDLCDLSTILTGADGRVLTTGRALVLVRDVVVAGGA